MSREESCLNAMQRYDNFLTINFSFQFESVLPNFVQLLPFYHYQFF